MRSILVLFCFLNAVYCYAQQNVAYKIPKKSFITLSDSILIKKDVHNELAVIYEQARNKKIVAIGEVTHGTKEVMEFQHLIATQLVKLHHFNCIVLGEISMLDSYKINDYVVNERRSVADIMIKKKIRARDAAYRQRDMMPLYIWIRNFNKQRPFKEKIWVIGTDIDQPEEIISFLKEHCLNHGINKAVPILEELNKNLRKLPNSAKININTIADSANQLLSILENSRVNSDSTNMKTDVMVRVLKTLPNSMAFWSDNDLKYKMRDKFIFENIEWLRETCKKDKQVIIRAHNMHINKKTIYTEIFGKFPSFGEYLSKQYQTDYMSIGTEVQKGRFYAGFSGSSKIAQHKNKLGTIIGCQAKAKYGVLLCDSSSKEFLNQPSHTMTFGTINYRSSILINCKGLIGDAFDAIVFIKDSTPYQLVRDYFIGELNKQPY
ncbi:erythromycin esterase family protein [Emticicia sp. C21]|uniref:erythromycin esterase family protein n=1 Tax=Emticicia sp. C21 TaxID=2302915 RepID=UPI000E3533AE|nr:erythromycin esterase family protein [Emticicia sp. C21]RFS17983.1 hypothetical protein D0T08_01695 [Emticicia sp. C21]